MQESGAMPQEEASSAKSPLDKPLQQLTEDDIAQVTREDCRRYLKEKGMRRPSWNKSQAIQQVIMLKALLETPADCDSDFRKRLRISRPSKVNDSHAIYENVTRGTNGEAENSVLAEDTASYRRKDLEKLDHSSCFSERFASSYDGAALPRTTVSTNMPVGQMTIFYSGRVNVYEDVSADKARAIMHVAANPIRFPREHPADASISMQPPPSLSKVVNTKACRDSNSINFSGQETVKTIDNSRALGEETNMFREDIPGEGPSSRKASIQRYLEKKKDRFKTKKKAVPTSCTSLDIYVSHQMGNQTTNVPLKGTCSPPQLSPPSTQKRCCSVDNDFVKSVCSSSGLNN